MSTNTTPGVEVTPELVDTLVQNTEDLVASNQHCLTMDSPDSLVEGYKKEYSIIGDGLYASLSEQETPAWLAVLIDNVIANAVANGMMDYDLLVQDVRNAIDSINVAKNTYVEQINFDTLVNSIISSRLQTLNATLNTTFATIVDLDTAVASADDALTQRTTELEASLTDEIDSRITTVESAYATADATLATNIDTLQTAFNDQIADFQGTADAVTGLQTYVGIDPTSNTPNNTGLLSSVTSISQAFTNLENNVTGPSGDTAYSLSNLQQESKVYADTVGVNVENKFAYDANVVINGNTYIAGFGLDASGTSGGSGTVSDPYDSEFWVNAEKFKFTNTNKTGTVSPFTIDASGTTPQIHFNGIVDFSNVTNSPATSSGPLNPTGNAVNGSTYLNTTNNSIWVYNNGWKVAGNPNALTAEDLGPTGTTIIDGGRIVTDNLASLSVNAGTLTAGILRNESGSFIINLTDGTIVIKTV